MPSSWASAKDPDEGRHTRSVILFAAGTGAAMVVFADVVSGSGGLPRPPRVPHAVSGRRLGAQYRPSPGAALLLALPRHQCVHIQIVRPVRPVCESV